MSFNFLELTNWDSFDQLIKPAISSDFNNYHIYYEAIWFRF